MTSKPVTTYIWWERVYYIKVSPYCCEIIQSCSQVFLMLQFQKKTNHPVFLIFKFFKFWPRIQDRSCSSRQFRCSQAAAVGHRPQFRWPLSSRQDQHRRDPAPAAGPADAYAEPQLHSSGSAAGTRGQREDPCMWRLQQNHKVRRRSHSCSDSLIHFSRVKSSQCLCLFQSAVRRSDTSFRTFNTHDDRLNVCSQHN